MVINIIFYCAALAIFWFLHRIVNKSKTYSCAMKNIPSPPEKPIVGHLGEILGSTEELWSKLRRWGKEYYPIYKTRVFNSFEVTIMSPEDIEILLSGSTHLKKGDDYAPLKGWLQDGLLLSEGKKWQKRRKLLTPTFHFSILGEFLKIFIKETNVLVKKLEKECDKASTDVTPLLSVCALKAITDTAMGIKVDEEDERQRTYLESVQRIGNIATYRLTRPWLYVDFLYWFSPTYRKEKEVVDYLHTHSTSIIKKRLKEFKLPNSDNSTLDDSYSTRKRLAMLDLLIKSMMETGEIDEDGIREEVDTFMFGGHDTTSTSSSFTLMLLACHPDIQERVREEIRDVLGEKPQEFTQQDLQGLKYMEMVIKESLRIYPSVPSITRRLSEPMTTRSGYLIPAGIEVSVSIIDLHLNEKIWPNPTKFDPERFLPDNIKGRHPYAYIPFSAGPRNCIGQKYGMLEMKVFLVGILSNFVLLPVDTPDTIVHRVDLVNRTTTGIKIKFRKLDSK